jgi:hypothetical protein
LDSIQRPSRGLEISNQISTVQVQPLTRHPAGRKTGANMVLFVPINNTTHNLNNYHTIRHTQFASHKAKDVTGWPSQFTTDTRYKPVPIHQTSSKFSPHITGTYWYQCTKGLQIINTSPHQHNLVQFKPTRQNSSTKRHTTRTDNQIGFRYNASKVQHKGTKLTVSKANRGREGI